MKKVAMFKIIDPTLYTGINLDAEHEFAGIANKARRGDIVLNVKHINGHVTDLSFKFDEVEQVGSHVVMEG